MKSLIKNKLHRFKFDQLNLTFILLPLQNDILSKWRMYSQNSDRRGRAVEERRKSEGENASWKNKEGAQRRFPPFNRCCAP